jgi:glycosyltransferase involved in cell wall biosynthesis
MPDNPLSIVVCTRSRSESLNRTVRSLLSNTTPCELIVVDQSSDREFERALTGFKADPRLRHVRSRARGKGAALNEGLALARGEIVVCTDDDCEAPAGWVEGMARTLSERPDVAVAFCTVVAGPCDWNAGYVPVYAIPRSRLLTSLLQTCTGHGMGAGMALRRDVVLKLGGFDEEVGPGARFPSGDDWDICHRALLTGWGVYETADFAIVHHGFRTLEEGRQHAHRDWLAIGAVCAKPIRAGHLTAVTLPVWYFSIHALWPPLRDVLRLQRPRGWSRIAGFVDGFLQGLCTPVSRPELLFERRARGGSVAAIADPGPAQEASESAAGGTRARIRP